MLPSFREYRTFSCVDERTKGGNQMDVFIARPSIDLYPGVRVTKDTVLEYNSEDLEQRVENLVFRSKTRIASDEFESVHDTTIKLKEGDILIFEDGKRGYIKPVMQFCTISEAIEDLTNIKDLG
jgi:hypothetical protein